jgi:uncharacterized membrane protein (DUF373 family)
LSNALGQSANQLKPGGLVLAALQIAWAMPDDVLELMKLYSQPVRTQAGGVEYLPVPKQKEAIGQGRGPRGKERTMTERTGEAGQQWRRLSLYHKFEHIVIGVLTVLIAGLVLLALWNLVLKLFASIVATGIDPTDYAVFQAVFGMIFTVIIALEFERSLLVLAKRERGIVQVRTVILIALLAIVRKLMIMDMGAADVGEIFALAAAVLALGAVYWLVRDQERRDDDI